MSRDDSGLYTGITSAAFGSTSERKVRQQRSQQQDEKIEVRGKLQPAAEVVNEMIASEKASITQKLAQLPINYETSEESVKSTLLAIQMNLAFIDRFHNKVNNVMREPRKAKQAQDEATDE